MKKILFCLCALIFSISIYAQNIGTIIYHGGITIWDSLPDPPPSTPPTLPLFSAFQSVVQSVATVTYDDGLITVNVNTNVQNVHVQIKAVDGSIMYEAIMLTNTLVVDLSDWYKGAYNVILVAK